MVLQVVLLQRAVPRGQVAVVQEVVCQVVADVSEDASAVERGSCVPVVEENGMCQFPEGRGEHDE